MENNVRQVVFFHCYLLGLFIFIIYFSTCCFIQYCITFDYLILSVIWINTDCPPSSEDKVEVKDKDLFLYLYRD